MNTIAADKTILITGGTGSVGATAVRRFLESGAREVRIFSRDRQKQDALRQSLNCARVTFHAGDILDRASLDRAMAGVDLVLSLAAVKEIPACEAAPIMALKINALGAINVIDSALAGGVGKIVTASSDKAVYPVSAMGLSKAMMEKAAVARARVAEGAAVCCVRYSNILASRGSVVRVWAEQLKAGHPITITDPEMTRFIMTDDDAVDLATFTWEQGSPGDILVKKSPAATLATLANALKKLYNSNAEIRITGARPGEKPADSLLTDEELARAVAIGDCYRIPAASRPEEHRADIPAAVCNSRTAIHLDVAEMISLLLKTSFIRTDLGIC